MFADDTNIVVKADSYESLCKLTNKVLSIVSTWLLLNRIAVSTKKCTLISFGCKSLSNVELCSAKLSASNSSKYIDVVIDENLTFQNHPEKVIIKLNQSIGIFQKSTNLINDKTKFSCTTVSFFRIPTFVLLYMVINIHLLLKHSV